MLTIEIELLTGRYVATQANDRSRVEWPPHPARFFSALVAASGHVSTRPPQVRDVLLCLEDLPAPTITASNLLAGDLRAPPAGARTVNTVFVPVNDSQLVADGWEKHHARLATAKPKEVSKLQESMRAALKLDGAPTRADFEKATALLPAGRPRKERTFPSFAPDVPKVWFSWPESTLSPEHTSSLDALLDRVTALGHSSSQVRCALVAAPPTGALLKTLVPLRSGLVTLRWVAAGQLERLDQEFERHQAHRPRVLPARPVAYGVAKPASGTRHSVFEADGWLVLRHQVSGRVQRFQSTRCVDIAKALHGALATHASPQPAPAIITGRREGVAMKGEHLALLPLPDVGHQHAHGGVMGVAIVFPRSASEADRIVVIDALGRFLGSGGLLTLPRGAVLQVVHEEFPEALALREATWARPSTHWATVTPIALDRNPGDLRRPEALAEAARTISDGCEHLGLPRPIGVEVSLSPYVAGSQPVRAFEPFPREANRLRKLRVHALLQFGEAVEGPIVVGAGRFFGLGLCRPLNGGAE
jgi:CRISPR-associated protein Csb2